MAKQRKTGPKPIQMLQEVKISTIECPVGIVRIFGRDFQVNFKPAEHMVDDLGTTHANDSKIDIRMGQSPLEERDTVLHEVIHAIDHTMEIGLKEKQVVVLAHGLIGVFQDNPEFAKYIIEQIKT